jgi:hypothetical protein
MLEFLLKLGADPNASLPNIPTTDDSVWYNFLIGLEKDFQKNPRIQLGI